MEAIEKLKVWINENAPMFSKVYENKYVGMAYDRFASLQPRQQKQVILGIFGGVLAIVLGYLLFSYQTLWSYSSQVSESATMVHMLQQYQKQHRDKASQIQNLERNKQLANPGEFKQHLMAQARAAPESISPRLITVEEKPESSGGEEDPKGNHDVKMKEAKVTLTRVNLSQLKAFLQKVELGDFNLSISNL